MQRQILSACLLGGLTACYGLHPKTESPIFYAASIHDSDQKPLLKHEGAGPWDNYLTLNLPFEPVSQIRQQLETKLGTALKHRGEAHITVITPVEYWQALRPFLSMKDIYALAQAEGLQKSQFRVRCVGRGQVTLAGKPLYTYYLVAPSLALQSFRQKVWQRFVQKGGNPMAFQPTHFYPHITLGFDQRDLHESDGVLKDAKTCMENVTLNEVATRESRGY